MLDKAANIETNNYFIEEIINENGKIIENNRMYFLKENIKYVKVNNNNSLDIDSYEIIDDKNYYLVDNILKQYSMIDKEEYYQRQMDIDTILVKDHVVNDIYKDVFSLKNNGYIKLIFMFNVDTKIGDNNEFMIEFNDKMINASNVENRIIFNKFEFNHNLSYDIKLDCVESKEFDFYVKEDYIKIDI